MTNNEVLILPLSEVGNPNSEVQFFFFDSELLDGVGEPTLTSKSHDGTVRRYSAGGSGVQEVFFLASLAAFPLVGTDNTLYGAKDTNLIYRWDGSTYVELSPSGDEVQFYADLASFPVTGVDETIYAAEDTNLIYRWDGSTYVELSPSTGTSDVFFFATLAGFPVTGVDNVIYGAKDTDILYRWNGVTYEEVSPGGSSNVWLLNGNTVGSVKTIGTIDNFDFPIITNNSERARVLDSGEVGIGTTTPSSLLSINSAASGVFGANGLKITKANLDRVLINYFDGFGGYIRVYRDDGVTNAFEFIGSGADSYINTGMDFGIQTTNPVDTLHVEPVSGKGILITAPGGGANERAWMRQFIGYGGYLRLLRDDGSTNGLELAAQGTRGYINTGQNFAIGTASDMGATLGVTGYQRNIGNIQVEQGKVITGQDAFNNGVINKVLWAKTADAATATELTTDGAAGSGSTNRIPIPLDTAMSVELNICVKQQSSSNCWQMRRQFIVVNNGGASTLEGAVITLGTDNGSIALATVSCTVTANNTDDCIRIDVNGVIATNLEYTAYLTSCETAYLP